MRGHLGAYTNDFCAFYLPDLLWALSLGCAIQGACLPTGKGKLYCVLTGFLWGVLWELGQWSGVISGVGDYWDLLMYLLGSALSLLFNLEGDRK